jgi:hypothetical protein
MEKENIETTAEEFFRNKIKELSPCRAVITLSQEIITAEQAMRWANEFAKLKNNESSQKNEQSLNIDLSHDKIKALCDYHLKYGIDLTTFKPKEIIFFENCFIQGANVMMNYILARPQSEKIKINSSEEINYDITKEE